MLELMGAAIRKERVDTLADREIHWEQLIQESKAQAVSLLLFDGISHLQGEIPEPVYQSCFALARRMTARNLRTEHIQSTLVSMLDRDGHPYVILKGEAAAAYYPVPEYRQLGDVDFLTYEENAPAIIEKLKQQGYTHSCEEDDYHQILIQGKDRMELHFEVAGIPEGKAGEEVRSYLADVIPQGKSIDRGAGAYRVPCDAHHGLIILLHMQHHMVSLGLGLRHIMDWACFVQRTWEQPFWQGQLLPLLERIGLLYYGAVLTKMCSLFLGTVCPQWAAYAEENLCRELMEDLLAGGNFGRKDKDRARSTVMLPENTGDQKKSKTALLYKTLHNAVLKQNPGLAQRPVARTAAMTWKACRYLVLYARGKRPNLVKAAACADVRRSVYDRLKMYETD